MTRSCGDPTIHELLDDPLTRAVMQADRVDPLALRQMLGSVALAIESAARPSRNLSRGGPRRSGIGRWFRSQLCGAC